MCISACVRERGLRHILLREYSSYRFSLHPTQKSFKVILLIMKEVEASIYQKSFKLYSLLSVVVNNYMSSMGYL